MTYRTAIERSDRFFIGDEMYGILYAEPTRIVHFDRESKTFKTVYTGTEEECYAKSEEMTANHKRG